MKVTKKPTQRSGVKRKRQDTVNQTTPYDDHYPQSENLGIKNRLRRSSRLRGQVDIYIYNNYWTMQRACHFHTDSHFWKGSDNLSASEPCCINFCKPQKYSFMEKRLMLALSLNVFHVAALPVFLYLLFQMACWLALWPITAFWTIWSDNTTF